MTCHAHRDARQLPLACACSAPRPGARRRRPSLVLLPVLLAVLAAGGCQQLRLPWSPPGTLIVELPPDGPAAADSLFYLQRDGELERDGEGRALRGRRLWHARVQVESAGAAFRPSLTAVRVGDEVRFANGGNVAHRLFTTRDGERVERFLAPRGTSAPFRVTREGAHRFYCSLHPDEDFVIFAPASRHFAVARGERRVRIDGVPAGRYRLRWFGPHGLRELGPVEIHPGVEVSHALSPAAGFEGAR